ncbi:MAG: transcriptional regulator [Rhodospirillales bacterium 20-60-12]|nr:MAG: transcriptional regulator [Rhodospirillales bacterium 20-60-12]HQT67936.1 helix-turn-helix domain-containing protein [Acetobacteraceae bacterium]
MNSTQAVADLAALAHEHRLAAFRLLIATGPAGLPAGLIADRLHLPPSSLTFHLQQLLAAGLVSQRRVSRQIIYQANFDAMNRLLVYLSENCCGRSDAPAFCQPAAQLESSS